VSDGFPVEHAYRLQQLPEAQQWLIEGLWGHEAVGIIGGEPKCCKSFLALGMAVALASGRPCLGHFAVPRTGSVLLFAAEDALHIVRRRLDGICAHHGVELAALDLWAITAPVIRLDHRDDQRRLEDTIAQHEPRLLILDPFVRLHRIDENLSAAVAPLLAFLRELQRRHQCAVALVHHARKGGASRAGQALRGSSELHAWGDSNLYLRRRGEHLSLTIEHRAQPSQAGIPLELRHSGNAAAVVVTDVAPPADAPSSFRSAERSDRDRVLAALNTLETPMRLRQLRAACRMRAASLTAVLRELVAAGVIARAPNGWTLSKPQQIERQLAQGR
jgi:hypothetical protein